MRPRRATPDEVAETARRRLDLLTAELAMLRDEAGPDGASHETRDGSAVGAVPVPDGPSETPGRHARRSVGLGQRTGGWVLDRLPPTLQGRARLGPGAVGVVALLVLAGMVVTAWWVVRADEGEVVPVASTSHRATGPEDEPLVPALTEGDPVAAEAATQMAGEASSVVVVDVTGRVRRRGIVTLPLGSRVVDAVAAAGGARKGTDLRTLNLARVLVDGEQVVVGTPPPGGVAASAASGAAAPTPRGALLNLNLASQSELETLPGVGPVTAEAIVAWRTDHGRFTSVDELLEVSGIGEARLADIAPHVTL